MRIRRADSQAIIEVYLNDRNMNTPVLEVTDQEDPIWGVAGVPGFEFLSPELDVQPAGASPFELAALPIMRCHLFEVQTVKDFHRPASVVPSNLWTYDRVIDRVILLVEKDGDATFAPTHSLRPFENALETVRVRGGMAPEAKLDFLQPYFPKGVHLVRRILRKEDNGVFLVYSGAMKNQRSPTFHALKMLLALFGFRDFMADCGPAQETRGGSGAEAVSSGMTYPLLKEGQCSDGKMEVADQAMLHRYHYRRILNLWCGSLYEKSGKKYVDVIEQVVRQKTMLENGSGKFIKVIMINDDSVEGISFLNTVHLEVLNPPYTATKLKQLLGRIRRMKGMCGIKKQEHRMALYRFYVAHNNQPQRELVIQGGAPSPDDADPLQYLQKLDVPTSEIDIDDIGTEGDRYAQYHHTGAEERGDQEIDEEDRQWRPRPLQAEDATSATVSNQNTLSQWRSRTELKRYFRRQRKLQGEEAFLGGLFREKRNLTRYLDDALKSFSVDCMANRALHPNNVCWTQGGDLYRDDDNGDKTQLQQEVNDLEQKIRSMS